MTSFLFFHKCDWCGRWVTFKFGWITNEEEEYCSGVCAEKKTMNIRTPNIHQEF